MARLSPWRLLARLRTAVRETLALRAADGPYRFLTRGFTGLGDPELAARVIGTDYFAPELQPLPLPIDTVRRILVLAPHQDDEVIGAGGTLRLAADAGAAIDVLYLTDGAQEGVGYAADAGRSAAVRAAEAAEVCRLLGARKHDLGLDNRRPRPSREHLARLAALVAERRPQVVMAPWLLDSPAKHRLVNHLLWLAARCHRLPDFELWGYQVHNALYPNGLVEITAVADAKRALLACYRSQNEHCQRYDHLAMAMAAWGSRYLSDAPLARYVELFFALPRDALLELVGRFYFADLERTYRGHRPVIEGAQALHRAVTGAAP